MTDFIHMYLYNGIHCIIHFMILGPPFDCTENDVKKAFGKVTYFF